MNIARILRSFPQGTKLLFRSQYVYLKKVLHGSLIIAETSDTYTVTFNSDGSLSTYPQGGCVLFPSKDEKNWNRFIASNRKNELIKKEESYSDDSYITKTLHKKIKYGKTSRKSKGLF